MDVKESEILVHPITDDDKTSLQQKLSSCGLTDLGQNFTYETYKDNTQLITQDLVLTENELGVLLNTVMFDESFYLRELDIIGADTTKLEFKILVRADQIINTNILGPLNIYCNVSFDINYQDNTFSTSNITSYVYGSDQPPTTILDPDNQTQDLMIIFNGNETIRSLAEIIGASSIEFNQDTFVARC